MRILIALTYYRPHTSGLTIYVERLSKALAVRGHHVTVLTSHFDPHLPYNEIQDGVHIIRVPVLFRLSKGVIMPTFGWAANKLVADYDILHLHLPQFDAAGLALRGRLMHKPTVITYHCDLTMPPGLFNFAVNQVVHVMNHVAAVNADRIITYTQDFADHSPYLRRYADKVHIISPPVELPPSSNEAQRRLSLLSLRQNGYGGPFIGMAARLAAEKGVEILLDSLPAILEKYPNATVLFAGQVREVLGEEAYFRRLMPRIRSFEQHGHWKTLGVLSPEEMSAFYHALDLLVVPSLNSTESFGLVQIEAMMNGIPVVASNLPGVRQPVLMSGMGEIAEVGDGHSLSAGILKVLAQPQAYRNKAAGILHEFNPHSTAAAYERLFGSLLGE